VEDTGQTSTLFKSRKTGSQRKDIYDKYLSKVENESTQFSASTQIHKCPSCGSTELEHDHMTSDDICRSCGTTLYVQCEEVGFREEQDIEKTIVYSYRRENHFNEWIAQFQAKESTNVPSDVIEKLRNEFRKQKIKDVSEITHARVKEFLKKLGLSKYYEHVPYITTILNGIQPPTMPQALEDKLRIMFKHIEAAWEKNKPADRKNFLSYSYTLYKMCELLGEDDYLPCFQLLKSKEKRDAIREIADRDPEYKAILKKQNKDKEIARNIKRYLLLMEQKTKETREISESI
jgi:transcription initiation factor TFIIIB Brf1 subunit/transcription initiation factor TFIIB